MEFDQFISLLTLTFVASWTPGPNNALVASSGAMFGVKRTLPHVAGIGIGFCMLFLGVSLGLGPLFTYSPFLREALRWVGVVILIWLAWKIATSGRPGTSATQHQPFTFVQSFMFQWVNPKGWVIAISIVSQFVTVGNAISNVAVIAVVSLFWGWSSSFGWAVFGRQMQRFLHTPARLQAFNVTMAVLLLWSVYSIAGSDF